MNDWASYAHWAHLHSEYERAHGHIYRHAGWPLFSARPFICRKTLWCISFDAVCALVMQIPRRPVGFGSADFQRYRCDRCLFGRSRGMEIPHRQGRVNFDMYVRNRRANYTAAMHNAWEPNGNRLHHGERQAKSEKEKRESAKVDVVFSSLSTVQRSSALRDSLSESETFKPSPFSYNIAVLLR